MIGGNMNRNSKNTEGYGTGQKRREAEGSGENTRT